MRILYFERLHGAPYNLNGSRSSSKSVSGVVNLRPCCLLERTFDVTAPLGMSSPRQRVPERGSHAEVLLRTRTWKMQLWRLMPGLILTMHRCCQPRRYWMTEGWAGRTSLPCFCLLVAFAL